jgi:hypothetical protein
MPAEAGIQSGGHSADIPGPALRRFCGGEEQKAAGVVRLVATTSGRQDRWRTRSITSSSDPAPAAQPLAARLAEAGRSVLLPEAGGDLHQLSGTNHYRPPEDVLTLLAKAS